MCKIYPQSIYQIEFRNKVLIIIIAQFRNLHYNAHANRKIADRHIHPQHIYQ